MDWANFLRIMQLEEEAAQAKYRIAVESASDPSVRDLMERLAYEEEIHVGILQKEIDRLNAPAAK